MPCDIGCYEATVQSCDDITVIAGLPPSTSFYVQLNRWWNNKLYQRQITTDGTGKLIIQKSLFPTGFFVGGHYKLQLRKADGTFAIQPMIFATKEYNCCLLNVVDISVAEGDNSPIDTVK